MENSVFGKNLALLRQKEKTLASVRNSVFHEAAGYYISTVTDYISAESVSGFFSEAFDENDLLTDDYALFCHAVAEKNGGRFNYSFSFGDREQKNDSFPKIAYHRNPLSDRAYMIFSDRISGSSAVYFTSFKDVCEDVFYGRSDYAIIPVYTSSDGVLSSFRKMILKYDLKIVYMANIEQDDIQTRFALVKKGLSPLDFSEDGTEINLLVSVIPSQKQGFCEIVSALSGSCAEIDFVSTHTVEYSVTGSSYDVNLRTEMKNIPALFLFLEGSHIRFELLGIYSMIA